MSLKDFFEVKWDEYDKEIENDGTKVKSKIKVREKNMVVKGTDIGLKLHHGNWEQIDLHILDTFDTFVASQNAPPCEFLQALVAETWLIHYFKGTFHADDKHEKLHDRFVTEEKQIACVVQSVKEELFKSNELTEKARLLCIICEEKNMTQVQRDSNLMAWTTSQWLGYCKDVYESTFKHQPKTGVFNTVVSMVSAVVSKVKNTLSFPVRYFGKSASWVTEYRDWVLNRQSKDLKAQYFTYLTWSKSLHSIRVNGQFDTTQINDLISCIPNHNDLIAISKFKSLKDLFQNNSTLHWLQCKLILFVLPSLSWTTLVSVSLPDLHALITYLAQQVIEQDWSASEIKDKTTLSTNVNLTYNKSSILQTLATMSNVMHVSNEDNEMLSHERMTDPVYKQCARLQHMICEFFNSNRLYFENNLFLFAIRALIPSKSHIKWSQEEQLIGVLEKLSECMTHINSWLPSSQMTRYSLRALRNSTKGIEITSDWQHINEFEDFILNAPSDFFKQIESNIKVINECKVKYFEEHLQTVLTDDKVSYDEQLLGSNREAGSALRARKARITFLLENYKKQPAHRDLRQVMLDCVQEYKKKYLEFPSRHHVMLKFFSWICNLSYFDYENAKKDQDDLRSLKFVAPQHGSETGEDKQDWSRNMIVVGNPGCGKTTFITFIRKVLIKLGLIFGHGIEKANVIQTGYRAKDLMSGVTNQTLNATSKSVAERLDDVYFLDEAYDLIYNIDSNNPTGFQRDAYNQLMSEIGDWSWCTLFIIAGYEEKMKGFNSNEGYIRRMNTDTTVVLKDYTVSESAILFRNHVLQRLKAKSMKIAGLHESLNTLIIESKFIGLFKSASLKQGVTTVTKYADTVIDTLIISMTKIVSNELKTNITQKVAKIMEDQMKYVAKLDEAEKKPESPLK